MRKLVFLALMIVAQPVTAATIDQAKLKPAKMSFETSMDTVAAIHCVQSSWPYANFAINKLDNPDGTIDLAVIDSGTRIALWTLNGTAERTTFEGRGLWATKLLSTRLRECLGLHND